MNESRKVEYLLKYLYKRFMEDDVVRSYGITPWVLIDNSRIRSLGIDVGDGLAQVATVDRMRERGWIKILNPTRDNKLHHTSNVQLTEEGIKEAERLLSPLVVRYLRDVFVAIVEGITRAKS